MPEQCIARCGSNTLDVVELTMQLRLAALVAMVPYTEAVSLVAQPLDNPE